jgi:hypothetical protein
MKRAKTSGMGHQQSQSNLNFVAYGNLFLVRVARHAVAKLYGCKGEGRDANGRGGFVDPRGRAQV